MSLATKGLSVEGSCLIHGKRRQRRLAMRIDRRVADGIQFAFSRRLNGVGFFSGIGRAPRFSQLLRLADW